MLNYYKSVVKIGNELLKIGKSKFKNDYSAKMMTPSDECTGTLSFVI